MNLGSLGRDLLKDLKRSEWLPPYNEEGVRAISQQSQTLWNELVSISGSGKREDIPDPVKVAMVVHHQSILRNKRCSMAYLKYRLDKIQMLRWDVGPIVPELLQDKLHPREMGYFSNYDRLVNEYMMFHEMDLISTQDPPKDIYIEIRCLEDVGMIMTDDGRTLQLERGTTHFIKKSDVDHLLRQGSVEEIQS